MEVAAGAMTPLLRKLGELLAGELTLEKRVREDVVSLQMELTAMHAALRWVAEVPPGQLDGPAALWACEVRELSYDMEDAVDAFAARVGEPADNQTSRVRELLSRATRLFSKGRALHQISGAIGDVKSLAKQLGELRQRYGGLELQDHRGAAASSTIDPRLTAMFNEVTELVGVDGPRDELIKMLSDWSKKHVQTFSIVGFGGLGKTTLAKAVYDRIKVQFDCGAFVSVSRNPDLTKVFKKVLYGLDEVKYCDINEAVGFKDEEQLIREVRGFLRNKRYLIVIDDIWDEKMWKVIKCAFPRNNRSSRLITTTRKFSVSEAACSSIDEKIYKLKPLSDHDSLRLFHARIFHRGNRCPPELEQLSRDILKKCGGVPLAIISIASILANHKQIKAKDEWYILLNSIGHGPTGGGNDIEDMQQILSFSYYDLPCHLKTCLLYLSIFPEDYEIRRDRLIWRWIAEGFIQHEGNGNNLFELGESYFNELINRSMILPVDIDVEGRALACRVHDMVLALLRSVSRQENFTTIWNDTNHDTPMQLQRKVRRLSLQNTTTTPRTTKCLSQARSFTVFNPAIGSMPSFSSFKVLRVLDLEDCDLMKHGLDLELRHVSSLSHLRYLGLRRTRIGEIPKEIGNLQFLLTLDVRGFRGVLPLSIVQSRQLMCLRLDWKTRLPKEEWNLVSLEELTGLSVGHDSAHVVRELGRLTRLRLLKVRWEDKDISRALVRSLGNLHMIQSLELYVYGGSGDHMSSWTPHPSLRRFFSRGPTSVLSALPSWVTSSSLSLTYVDIWVGQVRPEDVQALGALPVLRGLRLRATGGIEDRPAERLAVRAGAFPCARACTLLHFVTAPSMFGRGAMPRVQRLEFTLRAWDVARGGRLGPDDLRMGHLPSLEEVHVELWYRKEDGAGEAERVLRRAADVHHNRPVLRINKRISRRQG